MASAISLPPYLTNITDYLEQNEPKLWEWYYSTKIKDEHTDSIRLELLKSTYRIDPDSESTLYRTANNVAEHLQIQHPLTLYQAQQSQDINASLAYIPGEPHIIFYGPLLKNLRTNEVEAIIGHELYHFVLLELEQQRYFTASQILSALAADHQADTSHYESARLFSLYTEIFCDRGALLATDDFDVTISALLKVFTGLDHINAQAYLKQSDEILTKVDKGSESTSHPENHLRTKALNIWFKDKDEDAIAKIIRGNISLSQLNLLEKKEMLLHTRTLLNLLLSYKWMRTDSVMAHARQFFHGNEESTKEDKENLISSIKTIGKDIQKYFCYVLLDFSVIDPNLDDAPLSACLMISEEIGLQKHFYDIARKELGLTKKKLDSTIKSAADIIETLNKVESTDE